MQLQDQFLCNTLLILLSDYKFLTDTKDGTTELDWSTETTTSACHDQGDCCLFRAALANLRLLLYPKPNAAALSYVMLQTAVGAVLQQHIGEQWFPIVYFFHNLQPAETCYTMFD